MDNKQIVIKLDTIIESANAIRMLLEASDKSAVTKHETIPDIADINWPEAVSQHLIINSKPGEDKSYKQIRARQIMGLMGMKLEGLKVLDVGCGEGFLAAEMAKSADVAWGYDITPDWNKVKRSNVHNLHYSDVASEVEAVAKVSPFDLIVLFDVVDHFEGESIIDFMYWVTSLLSENGQIFMRCHPWISRHGGHVYEEMTESSNKAFIHLTSLMPDEYREKYHSSVKAIRPLATYKKLIKHSGMKVKTENVITQPVESFFSGPLLRDIIDNTWNGEIDENTALKIMSTNFIDYVLMR